MPYRCRWRASRRSRAACASARTGTGPSAAAIPPTASRVIRAVRAPSRAALTPRTLRPGRPDDGNIGLFPVVTIGPGDEPAEPVKELGIGA